MFKTSIIIPVYNRPEELRDCVQSILEQTVKPDELIVVDDGDLAALPLEKECGAAGIKYIYFKKDKPGLTRSRNKGVSIASGDIIYFFDEDVVLFPDYIKETLNVYKDDNEGIIGGVTGVITNPRPSKLRSHLRRIFDIFFLVSGFSEGKVLPSGFTVGFRSTGIQIKKTKDVSFFPGCAMSFRKKIFHEFSFNAEKYNAYGGEEQDFSYRVSRKYKLIINPKAKLLHLKSPLMRPDKKVKARTLVLGRYMFFTDHMKKGWWSWLFFCYAMFGYTLTRIFVLIILPDKSKVAELKGIFSAIRDISKGNIIKVE